MPILDSKAHTLPSWCQTNCGNINISYPFGIQEGCYLNEWYKITCRNATSPFLFKMGKEVVLIDLLYPGYPGFSCSFGSIRVKIPMRSVGCSSDGKETGSALDLTDSPFFFGGGNSLVAVGCNMKASVTNIEPSLVGCESVELHSTATDSNLAQSGSKENDPVITLSIVGADCGDSRTCSKFETRSRRGKLPPFHPYADDLPPATSPSSPQVITKTTVVHQQSISET
ncbi:hypothetical protein Bca101_092839 [Brassica carinata]